MTIPLVLGIAGCVALLVGLFGGGVSAKDVEIPKISTLPRILSVVLGIALIGSGIWLSSPPAPSLTPIASPTAVIEPTFAVTSIAPAIPTQVPASFRIVETFLRADPFDYVGTCPVTITFSGRISVAGGSGTVSYKFLRSDGASAPIQTLNFNGSGSQDISETWQIAGSGMNYSGWEAIQIFDPQQMTSDRANFKIQCQ
jgi:hypothetical protein